MTKKRDKIIQLLDKIDRDINIQYGGDEASSSAVNLYFSLVDVFIKSYSININETSSSSIQIKYKSNQYINLDETNGSHGYTLLHRNNSINISNFIDMKNFRTYMCLNKHRFTNLKHFKYHSYDNSFMIMDKETNCST
jgi:hypothetical protein